MLVGHVRNGQAFASRFLVTYTAAEIYEFDPELAAPIVELTGNYKPSFQDSIESNFVIDFGPDAKENQRPKTQYVIGQFKDADNDAFSIEVVNKEELFTYSLDEDDTLIVYIDLEQMAK